MVIGNFNIVSFAFDEKLCTTFKARATWEKVQLCMASE